MIKYERYSELSFILKKGVINQSFVEVMLLKLYGESGKMNVFSFLFCWRHRAGRE